MMKYKKMMVALLTALLCGAALLTSGCASRSNVAEQPVAVALLVGNHANSKSINLNVPEATDIVEKAILSYGFVSVIGIDGYPEAVAANLYDIPDAYKNADASKLETDAKLKTNLLLSSVQGLMPNDPEVDVLAAFHLGVQSLTSAPSGSIKYIIVWDTGLSTAGPADYRNNLMMGDPAMIAEALDEMKAIPDLSGIEVIWLQMGEVAAPQQELSYRQKSQLESIWKAIIEKGGGRFSPMQVLSGSETLGADMPNVSLVDLQQEPPVKVEATALNFDEPQMISEEQVQFIPDSAEYADPDRAITEITPIADYMKKDTGFEILLAGTTAGDGDNEYTTILSQSRAEAVRKTLVDLGVSPDRISTIGLGSSDPWHIYGVGVEGELAALNRKVVLLDAKSQTAADLYK